MSTDINPSDNWVKRLFKKIWHKKFVIGVVLVILIGIGYYGYQRLKTDSGETTYVLATVTKGTLVTSVSGSGQVTVSQQVDIKPKVAGEITSLKIENGESIQAGTVIAIIDPSEAQKSIRNAMMDLESAQTSLEKISQPEDEFTISQARSDLEQAKLDLKKLKQAPEGSDLIAAQDAVAQAERDLEQAYDNSSTVDRDNSQALQKAYDDGYSAVSNAYLDLPNLVNDSYRVQRDDTADPSNRLRYYKDILDDDSPLISSLTDDYDDASDLFDTGFENYQNISRTSDQYTQYQLLRDTLTVAQAVSKSLESDRNVLEAVVNEHYEDTPIAAAVDLLRPKIQTDIAAIYKHIASLQNAINTIDTTNQNIPLEEKKSQNAIKSAQEKLNEKQMMLDSVQEGATSEDIAMAEQKIQQKQDALDKLLAGADPLDIQVQELNIQGKENNLQDAREQLVDYVIRAPFDGIVSKVNVANGDSLSSGTSIATYISTQVLADISLNEVDAAKVKVGNKVTVTFDAIEDLSLTGIVTEIDSIGTVTQGVVTYNVNIAFDTQDERVKPGMSVSASIITDVKQDVLLVPNAAVQTQGDTYYVEMFGAAPPQTLTSQNTTGEVTVSSATPPQQQTVETGLVNDTSTEITSDLEEGDQVVIRTINSNSTPTQTSTQNSPIRIGGGFGGGGGPPLD